MEYKEIQEGFELYEFRIGEPVGDCVVPADLINENNEVPF